MQTVAFYVFIEDYREAVRAGDTAWEVVTWADLVSLPLIGASIFAYVCTGLWLHRARKNVLALGGNESAHQRSAIWVWLGWWVPIVSFWFPYQVLRDVWSESQAPRRAPIGLGWWWTMWLLGLFTSRVADRMSTSNTSPLTDGTVDAIGVFSSISAVAAVIGVLLWARIVVGITRAQRDRARRLGIAMA